MPSEPSSDTNRSSDRAETEDQFVVTKLSPWSVTETIARLSAVVAARGMKVFAVIDHSDEARRMGLDLHDTKLFIVGSHHLPRRHDNGGDMHLVGGAGAGPLYQRAGCGIVE